LFTVRPAFAYFLFVKARPSPTAQSPTALFLKRFYDETLAQASYLIGCDTTGNAMVVDPNRDVQQYIDAARAEHLTIRMVTETHIHADFVSGARELAPKAKARLLLSSEGGTDWSYRFAAADGATLLRDGDAFDVGQVHVDVRHTPGHTPEHICFLLTDRNASDRAMGMLTGDFLFVGDVGRPDLLERAAKISGTMDAMARQLFRSIQRIADLPDYLQLWPGHGPGSACGKSLGAVPSTTLGYERIANWALQVSNEDEFVEAVLEGQPEPPKYFAMMKTVNRDGPAPTPTANPARVDAQMLAARLAEGAPVLDMRGSAKFAAEHIPGTINIPFGKSFSNWAGSLMPYDRDLVLLAEDRAHLDRGLRALRLIGLDRVTGWGDAAVRAEWRASGRPLGKTASVDVETLARERDVTVIDVRSDTEWNAGHIAGSRHLFLADLAVLADDLPRDLPIVTLCQGGTRSAIAASILRGKGFSNVRNFPGGFDAWIDAGQPIETEQPAAHR
jgi:hydroxyacylglutathione hydrolase